MQNALVDVGVSVSDVRQSSPAVLRLAASTVLNHCGVMGLQGSRQAYEAMIELLDDLELAQVAKARLDAGEKPVRVSLDDLIEEAEVDVVNGR